MATKKLTVKKTKSKPAQKPAKKKSANPPKATLNSVQLSLNKVVDKLSHHDTLFGKIDQRFDKIDERFVMIDQRFDKMEARIEKIDGQLGKVQIAAEHTLSGQIAGLGERQDNFSRELRELEERLINKIDESVTDLKAAITGHTVKLNNHETRISDLESHPA